MSASKQPPPIETLLAEEPFVRELALALSAGDAEDLVQQSYLRSLRTLSGEIRAPRRWLARIVRRLASNLRRDQRRRSERERRAARAELVPSSAELLEREERRAALVRAVDRLPAEIRAIVLLRYFDGLPPRRIAQELDLPAAAISHRLHRALALLRNELDAEHGDRRSWLLPLLPFTSLPSALPAVEAVARRALVPRLLRGLVMSSAAKSSVAVLCVALLILLGFVGLEVWNASLATGSLERAAPQIAAPGQELASTQDPAVARVRAAADAEVPLAEPPTLPPPRQGSLLVRVQWADGTPASDVSGYVSRTISTHPEEDLAGRTDAEGSFRLEKLVAGSVRVALFHGGDTRTAEIEAGRETEVRFEIPGGMELRGIVVDEALRAVPHARIWISRANRMWGEVVATTDEGGAFRMRDLSGRRFVVAMADRFQPSAMQSTEGAAGSRREITLMLTARGGAIEGSVVGASGEPLSGAEVSLVHRLAPPPSCTITAETGRFRFESVPCGEVHVRARAPGLAPSLVPVHVLADEAAQVAISLGRGATLTGIVCDETGGAIAGARVSCNCEAQRSYRETLSGADGSYRFADLPPGEHEITVHATDYEDAVERVWLAGEQSAERDLRLSSGRALFGQLTDDVELLPLAGWRVRAMPLPVSQEGIRMYAHPSRDGVTDAEGRFRIAALPAEPLSLLLFESPRQAIPVHAVDGVRAPGPELIVRVPAAARATSSFHGVLRDELGAALGSRRVHVTSAAEHGLTHHPTLSEEASGRFEMGSLPPGRYGLVIEWERSLHQRLEELVLAPMEHRDLGVLVRPAPGHLDVVVRDAAGETLGRSMHRILDARGWTLRASPLQSFALVPGEYVLLVSAAGMASASRAFTIRAGETTCVDVSLEPGHAVELAFSLPPGDGARNLELHFRDEAGSERWFERLQCSGEGFTWSGSLPPGSYRVDARADTGVSSSGAFELHADAPAPRRERWALR